MQRAELTDFDRFKLTHARRIRNKARRTIFFKLRAAKKRELREKRYAKKTGKAPQKEVKKKAPASKPEGKK